MSLFFNTLSTTNETLQLLAWLDIKCLNPWRVTICNSSSNISMSCFVFLGWGPNEAYFIKISLSYPVIFRIDFKVLLLIYKALNGQGPNCIAKSLVSYLPSRTLRSSAAGLIELPSNSWKKISDLTFVSYTSKLWNTLPIDIRAASSLDTFKRKPLSLPEHLNSFALALCCTV